MKRVTISQWLCLRLVMSRTGEPHRFNRGHTEFNMWVLQEGDPLRAEVEAETGLAFEVLRVHQWRAGDRAQRHVDDAFPGTDTMIVRLVGAGESQLLINDNLVEEPLGEGYLLPEHTPHEIIPGDHERWTLVGWVRQPPAKVYIRGSP